MPRTGESAVARNALQAIASPLQELEAKYEAVLAENEDLIHQLRLEQLQRQRYEKAYRRVQENVQSNRQSLQQMFALAESCPAGVGRHQVTGDATVITTSAVGSDDQLPRAAGNPTTFGTDENERVRRLEQECAYLQAKVDSLRIAFRQYERGGGEGAGDGSPHDTSPFRPREHAQRHCADNTTGSKALEAEQTEVFFHAQLAALQAQNAALLEDLDARVTAGQRLSMSAAFSRRFVASSPGTPLAPAATSTSSPTNAKAMRTPPNHQMTTPSVDFVADRVDASVPRQLERRTKRQEGLARAKDRTIVQPEGRARELGDAPAVAAAASENTSSQAATVTVYLDDLEQLRRDAHALKVTTLRFVREALSYVLSHPSCAAGPSSTMRVLQPTTVAEGYRSSGILSDAAKELADLMRRYAASTCHDGRV
ncbi:hypothetical protein CGC20_12675 [Leishmania donovani]|uniref:Uncharacterized protein n=1 Tax=Leishmania donovani TaxID=5661 RepID=A0A504X2M7_LEIDO|nr:hypothetical protein CGC20_12675 [Leishmania donovani]